MVTLELVVLWEMVTILISLYVEVMVAAVVGQGQEEAVQEVVQLVVLVAPEVQADHHLFPVPEVEVEAVVVVDKMIIMAEQVAVVEGGSAQTQRLVVAVTKMAIMTFSDVMTLGQLVIMIHL